MTQTGITSWSVHCLQSDFYRADALGAQWISGVSCPSQFIGDWEVDMKAPPKWLRPVAVLALLWNLIGLAASGMDLSLSAADIARLPAAQQELYASRPAWAVAATALAVVAGALGSAGLLLRKRLALPLLAASLLGIVLQELNLFVLTDGARLGGPEVTALQGLVLAVGIALVLLSRNGVKAGWLA